MFRIFEILIIIFLLPLIIFLFFIISLLILFETKGLIIHLSKRIGLNSKVFLMPKFRTMKINSPQVATHLLDDPDEYLTFFGKILRKISLDELPQVISIIKGDMSLVGPRPALFNQYDLIEKRKIHNIDKIKPGITGWAQINGRDELSITEKVELDKFYMIEKSIILDVKILLLTIVQVIFRRNVIH